MVRLDEDYYSRWTETRLTCMKIMREMDGTSYVIWQYVGSKKTFDEKAADSFIDNILSFLPDGFSKTKIQFYRDYLFMASLTAYLQAMMHEDPNCESDIIFDAGLGYDTCFTGLINRALIEDGFLAEKYGTKLVTGEMSDLNGYLQKIYKFRKNNIVFNNSDIYHPVFAGFGAIVDILNGRPYDDRLDRHSTEEKYNEFRDTFPCKDRFIKCYERYVKNYFKKGIRDDFQKNIEHIVKSFTIKMNLSHYGTDIQDEKARKIIEKALHDIWDLYYYEYKE